MLAIMVAEISAGVYELSKQKYSPNLRSRKALYFVD
jgi:hypothetical protein